MESRAGQRIAAQGRRVRAMISKENGVCAGDSMTCGDGVLLTACGEECDDGNNDPNDGCSADCMLEAQPVPIVPPPTLLALAVLLLGTGAWWLRKRRF